MITGLNSKKSHIPSKCSFTQNDKVVIENFDYSQFVSGIVAFKIQIRYTVGVAPASPYNVNIGHKISFFKNKATYTANSADSFLILTSNAGSPAVVKVYPSATFTEFLTLSSTQYTYNSGSNIFSLLFTAVPVSSLTIDGTFNLNLYMNGYFFINTDIVTVCCTSIVVKLLSETGTDSGIIGLGGVYPITLNNYASGVDYLSFALPASITTPASAIWSTATNFNFQIDFQINDYSSSNYFTGISFFKMEINTNQATYLIMDYAAKPVFTVGTGSASISSISKTPNKPTEIKVSIDKIAHSLVGRYMLLIEFSDNWSYDFSLSTDDASITCLLYVNLAVFDSTCYLHKNTNGYFGTGSNNLFGVTVAATTGTIAKNSDIQVYIPKLMMPGAITKISLKIINADSSRFILGSTAIHALYSTDLTSIIFTGDSTTFTNPAGTETTGGTLTVTSGSRTTSTLVSPFTVTFTGAGSMANGYIYVDLDVAGPVRYPASAAAVCTSGDIDINNCRLYPQPFGVVVAKITSAAAGITLSIADAYTPPIKYLKTGDYSLKIHVFDATNGDIVQSTSIVSVETDLSCQKITLLATDYNFAEINNFYASKYPTAISIYKTTFSLPIDLLPQSSGFTIIIRYTTASLSIGSACSVTTDYDSSLRNYPLYCDITVSGADTLIKLKSSVKIPSTPSNKNFYVVYPVQNPLTGVNPTIEIYSYYNTNTDYIMSYKRATTETFPTLSIYIKLKNFLD